MDSLNGNVLLHPQPTQDTLTSEPLISFEKVEEQRFLVHGPQVGSRCQVDLISISGKNRALLNPFENIGKTKVSGAWSENDKK